MFTHFFPSFFSQTAGKANQNGDILAAVRQHDRRVGFRQPRVRERSKYRCHEHARRGFTEHQRAVLIPFPSGCHPGCCHLTVHQQRAPCASPFIPHQQETVAFSSDVGHKNIKKRNILSCHCAVRCHFPSWTCRSASLWKSSVFVTHVISSCVIFVCKIYVLLWTVCLKMKTN